MSFLTYGAGFYAFYFLARKFSEMKKIPESVKNKLPDINNPAVVYGPNGIIRTDFYIRDDQADDQSGRRFNEWTNEDLRKNFGVILGDVEAIYGPHVESTYKTFTAETGLDPFYGKPQTNRPQVERDFYNVDEDSPAAQSYFFSN